MDEAVALSTSRHASLFNAQHRLTGSRAKSDLIRWMNAQTSAAATRPSDPGWLRLHDLRRAFQTEGQRLGIDGNAINQALSHVTLGATRRHYDFFDTWPARRLSISNSDLEASSFEETMCRFLKLETNKPAARQSTAGRKPWNHTLTNC